MFLLLALAMSKGSRLATVDYAYSKKEMDKLLNGGSNYEYIIPKDSGKCFEPLNGDSQADSWEMKDPPAANTYTLNVTFIGFKGEVFNESIVVVNGKVKRSLVKFDDKYYFNPGDFTFHMSRKDISDFNPYGSYPSGTACIDAMYNVEDVGFLVDYYKKEEVDDKFLGKDVYGEEEAEIEYRCIDSNDHIRDPELGRYTNIYLLKKPIDVSNAEGFEINLKAVKTLDAGGTTSYISKVITSEKINEDAIDDEGCFFLGYNNSKISYIRNECGQYRGDFISDFEYICIESIRKMNYLKYLPGYKVVGNIDDYKEGDVFSASAADERYARKGESNAKKAFTTSSFTYDLAGAFVQVAAEVKGDTALGVVFEGVIDFDENKLFSIDISEDYKLLITAASDNKVEIKLNKEEEKLAFGHIIIF